MPLQANVIASIIGTADRLGALPKSARKEWDRLKVLAEKVRFLELPAKSLPRAALAALEADVDMLTDADIGRAVISRALGDVRPAMTAELDDQMCDFIDLNGQDILDAFHKPFNEAAATLHHCLSRLGNIALEDAKAALSKGGDAAQVWADAQAADKTIDAIATAVKLMRRNAVDPRYRVLVIADIEAATFIEDQLTGAEMRAWDVARAGYKLSLADTATFDQRRNAIAAEMQQREEEARGAFGREYRRTRGDGGDGKTATVLS